MLLTNCSRFQPNKNPQAQMKTHNLATLSTTHKHRNHITKEIKRL